MRARTLAAPLACLLVVAPAVLAAPAEYLADGLGDDWSVSDAVGVSTLPPSDPNATVDLKSIAAADNATHWFFRLSFGWLTPGANASLALYLFGPEEGAPAQADPLGYSVDLPPGAALAYALYFELTPAFPAGSAVAFFDGVLWKNRTFAELGLVAARNDSAAFVEVAAPRAGLAFLHAGFAAAASLAPSGAGGLLTAVDAVPDDPAPPPGTIAGRVPFFDYSLEPPLGFSALGLSDPFAVEGDRTTVFVEITNAGPKNISGVSGRVTIDGAVLGSTTGLALLPGGTAVLSFEWQVTAGAHNVTAQSFPGGATRSVALHVPGALAELSILESAARPSTPAPGQSFLVDVRVRNDGNAASSGARLLLKDGTLVLSSAPLPPMAPGQTANVSLPATIGRAGAALLRIEIDGVNSANGSAQLTVLVSSPQPPLGIPALAWLAIGVGGCAAAAWLLTPRLLRRRKPREP